MQVGVIGINHRLAGLVLRERIALACQRWLEPSFFTRGTLSYVLLSTCNRTEIYFSAPDLAATQTYLLGILRREVQEIFELIYSFFGSDCFFHLVCVTAGLDSAIVGETEIQGQVKSAYELASRHGSLTPELHFLFQKSLKIGKELRSNYSLERGAQTVEGTIFQMGKQIFQNLKMAEILFVGVSCINHKIFSYFQQKGVNRITFCNRTLEKAESMGQKVLRWKDLSQWVDYDFVIFGTKSPHYLIELDSRISCKKRVVVDLSVPRNVDPRIKRIPGTSLLNIVQVSRIVEKKRKIKSCVLAKIEREARASVLHQTAIFASKQKFAQSLITSIH